MNPGVGVGQDDSGADIPTRIDLTMQSCPHFK
jgi:hypothetical protein